MPVSSTSIERLILDIKTNQIHILNSKDRYTTSILSMKLIFDQFCHTETVELLRAGHFFERRSFFLKRSL